MNMMDNVEKLIVEAKLLKSEFSARGAYTGFYNVLEALKAELSEPNPDSVKLRNLHYSLVRTYQEMLEMEGSPMGKDFETLSLQLNELERRSQ